MVITKDKSDMSPNQKQTLSGNTVFLGISIVSVIIAVVSLSMGLKELIGPFVVAFFVSLALYVRKHRVFSVVSFSLWICAFVVAPLFYPKAFSQWGPVSLKPFIIPLIMSVMFCMGTTLSFNDFKRVFAMPFAVFIGIILQYTIMPLVGKGVVMLFISNPEAAAGVIITGAAPGGVASNVINYLAGSNVPLSVTLTAASTILSPIFTPMWSKILAGTYVPVSFTDMMVSIMKMVIIPVGGGLVVNAFLDKMGKVNHFYADVYAFIMKVLPKLSMFAIAVSIAIMTANAREKILGGTVIYSIMIAVVIHNFFGLLLGYWGARLFGLKEIDCRTISVEVGMQNSGMAAGIAIDVLKSELASIPGVLYSSWHNISGAILASFWSRRKPGS
jgi:BASS family bile acid:Na+ symporter